MRTEHADEGMGAHPVGQAVADRADLYVDGLHVRQAVALQVGERRVGLHHLDSGHLLFTQRGADHVDPVESGLGRDRLLLSGEAKVPLCASLWLPSRLRTLDSFLAGGVVFCRVGPLELVGSGLRESREFGSPPPRERRHGHGLLVRDVPPGPSSWADDELGWIEAVHALRRAVSSLSRLPDGGNRADLCLSRGLPDASVLTPGIRVGPIAGERETGVERTPAEPGHLEEREDRLDRHLGGDLPADDHGPRGVDERDVGHPFGGADGGPVRDSARVRTFRVKDPVNEVGSDVGTTASVVTPRRRWTPRIPATAMSRATWSRPTSWPAFFAAMT